MANLRGSAIWNLRRRLSRRGAIHGGVPGIIAPSRRVLAPKNPHYGILLHAASYLPTPVITKSDRPSNDVLAECFPRPASCMRPSTPPAQKVAEPIPFPIPPAGSRGSCGCASIGFRLAPGTVPGNAACLGLAIDQRFLGKPSCQIAKGGPAHGRTHGKTRPEPARTLRM